MANISFTEEVAGIKKLFHRMAFSVLSIVKPIVKSFKELYEKLFTRIKNIRNVRDVLLLLFDIEVFTLISIAKITPWFFWQVEKYTKKLLASRIWKKRITMLIYAVPNIVVSIIAIVSFGIQLGWDKIFDFPYWLLWFVLLYSGLFSFFMKWSEPEEDEKEKKELIKDISDKVVQSVSDNQTLLTNELRQLIDEIRKDREDRNKK